MSESYVLWRAADSPKGWPEWKRAAGIDEATGDVFIPAVLVGPEEQVFMCACWDGTEPVQMFRRHVFVRTSWMAKEFPEASEVCVKIEGKMREALRGQSSPGQ